MAYQRRVDKKRYHEDEDYRQSKIDKVQKVRSRNKKIVDKHKSKTGCGKCGFNGHPVALEMHHIKPDQKSFRVGSLAVCLERLREEMKKCKVLCANCHRILHYKMEQRAKIKRAKDRERRRKLRKRSS